MTVLLQHRDVEALVSIDLAIDAMASVFELEGQGRTGEPQRFDIANGVGWLRLMPIVAEGLGVFGFKAMNLAEGVGVRYAIWVYDLGSGALRGILDARLITAMRTAATTAVATRLLAREQVSSTAIVGTGAEARTHLQAMCAVRPPGEVRIHSRSADNRQAFIREMSPKVDAKLRDCASLDQAVEGAELVVLATKSPVPVLHAAHLESGMHVNSIGSARADQFELARDTYERFDAIVCDSAAHVFTEAGDAIEAVNDKLIGVEDAVDLGDLVVGHSTGRTSADDVTLYKSVGTATQDIALALALLEHAEERDYGTHLPAFPDLKSFAPTE